MNQIYRHKSRASEISVAQLFSHRNKIFVRGFYMLLIILLFGQQTFAQTCNAVTNGTFTGITGWTGLAAGITPSSWGNTTGGSIPNVAFNAHDGANDNLSQTLTGVQPNGSKLSFDFLWSEGGSGANPFTLTVSYAGVNYLTIVSTVGNQGATGLATLTGLNGATVSQPTLQVVTNANLVISLPNGIPTTGLLKFNFVTSGISDDINPMDNVVLNTTCPPGAFTFNCGTSSTTGTFLANGTAGQTGTLILPITGTIAGAVTLNVAGTGFTGTLTTVLTAGQTSVTIPITYDGTGSVGNKTLTVTSTQGTGTCTKSVLVDIDSDGDGIADSTDLDDDNDGILDAVEQPCGLSRSWTQISPGVWESPLSSGYKTRITLGDYTNFWDGASLPQNTPNFNRACTGFTTDFGTIVNTNKPALQVSAANGSGAATNASFKVEFFDNANAPVTVKNPKFHLAGLGGSASLSGSQYITSSKWTLQSGTLQMLSSNGKISATSTSFVNANLAMVNSPSSTVSNDCATGEGSGTFVIQGPLSSYTFDVQMLNNVGTPANTAGFVSGDQFQILLEDCIAIDTDSDGIANNLDLDSDGDGCPDAIEGGANFAASTLVTSTMAGGNTGGTYTGTSTSPIVKNLGNTVGSTATTLGVPTVAGTGQTVGNSIDKLVQSANCSAPLTANNPPAQTATPSQVKNGTANTDLTPTGGNGTYVYSVDNSGSCTPISGATALPSGSVTVTNSTTGAYTYTAPATAGTYYYCIKVCDTSTPIPNCVTKTYTLNVTTAACTVTTAVPSLK